MPLIGLTGNYGMGKSSVLSMFREFGVPTIDSDAIVARLLQKKAVIRRVLELLGPAVRLPGGGLDKKMIAAMVFDNNTLRKKLEALLHPLVFREIEAFARIAGRKSPIVIAEVPLLFETGSAGRFQHVIAVSSTVKRARERLLRDGLSRRDIAARLRSQLPIRTKRALSDFVVDNSGSLEETREQVLDIYRRLLDEYGKGPTRPGRRPRAA